MVIPAQQSQADPFRPIPTLIEVAPNSDFTKFLGEIDELYHAFPEIAVAIQNDLYAHGIGEKKIRIADKRFEEQRTSELPNMDVKAKPEADQKITLDLGRPRTDRYLVYLFLMIRGHLGSITSKEAVTTIHESQSLRVLLANRNMTMPKPTTISENVNYVSNATEALILDCQIRKAFVEGLDDFQNLLGDSTAVHANSAWPTDSKMLHGIINRVFSFSQKLDCFNLPNFHKSRMPVWLQEMKSLTFTINLAAGKANSKKNLKKHYRALIKRGSQAIAHLTREYAAFEESYAPFASLKPSILARLKGVLEQMKNDLADALRVLEYTRDRVFKEIQLKSTEKVLSLCDEAAAYIKKGSRDPVIGYKPQLVCSGKGLIVSLTVHQGNVADTVNLSPMTLDAVSRTGVIPNSVSVDDGYASKAGAKNLKDMGIAIVSISGSKGKKITPEADWESPEYQAARAGRSAIESFIFTVKYCFNFGQLRRTGLDHVRSELLGKALAYNACRAVFLKEAAKKKADEERLRTAA